MTGPPLDRNDDETITADFMKDESAKHIVSGGTSATILSRELGRPLRVSMDYSDPDIPPIAFMEGIDLVTEGVLTLRKAIELLKRYLIECDLSSEFSASWTRKWCVHDREDFDRRLHGITYVCGNGGEQRLPESRDGV